jgi:hypothetical protein
MIKEMSNEIEPGTVSLLKSTWDKLKEVTGKKNKNEALAEAVQRTLDAEVYKYRGAL